MRIGIKNSLRHIVFLVVLACLATIVRAQKKVPPPPFQSPKPELLVSLSHSSIRENDEITVSVWISNDSDIPLTSLMLRMTIPESLQWHDNSCKGSKISGVVPLAPLAAHAKVSHTVCLTSGSEVNPGSLNILFTADFTWQINGQSGESIVSTEKPVTVALLGTDTLGGVPLGIAGLVAPGLLFWLILNAFGATWGPGIALGDKMIYSVLASAVIMILLSPIPYLNTRSGLSVFKLIYLAVIGALIGLVTGAIDLKIRCNKKKRMEAQTVRLGDDDKTALGKLLRLYKNKPIAKTTVRLKNGHQFVGALGEERPDLVTLVGWFRVTTVGKDAGLVAELKRLATEKKYVDLFDTAVRNNFSLEVSSAIATLRDADGKVITTDSSVRFWKPLDVEEVVPVTGDPKTPPVVVV